jgi:hypothetical protein
LGIIYWAFSQLSSYGVWQWVLILALTAAAAYLLRVPGIFLGHVLVATAIAVLDVQWIQSEMRKPGWDPNVGPDQDFAFVIGVVLRIVLINAALLPVSLLALRLRRSRLSRARRGLEVVNVPESSPGR